MSFPGVGLRVCVALAAVVALGAGASVAAETGRASVAGRSVFYLDMRVGQCALLPMKHKQLRVVPCFDGLHNLEVFTVAHGGWGLAQPPPHRVVLQLAFHVCTWTFLRRFGHLIKPPYGYVAYWPDPGAETDKYGDRMICALDLGASHGPMGQGTHFHS
jgi:hypothetical protein